MTTRRNFLAAAALLAGAMGGGVVGCAPGEQAIRGSMKFEPAAEPNPQVQRATLDFAGRLMAELGTDGNLVCSPLSIALALAMTSNGAVGETAAEFETLLGAPITTLNDGFSHLLAQLPQREGERARGKRRGKVAIASAQRLFGQTGVEWNSSFLDQLSAHYDAPINDVDFAANPNDAAAAMNAFIARATENKITDLVAADELNPDVLLTLINALYFAAPWAEPFSPPFDAEFITDAGPKQVPTMTVTAPMQTAVGAHYRMVSIPYLGNELAMAVALPNPGQAHLMLQSFAAGELNRVLANLQPAATTLTMPTWRYDTRLQLADVLQKLGLKRAFDEGLAQFDAMASTPLCLGKVLHGGWIAVDEEGTEAAAATVVEAIAVSAMQPDVELVLDRPFGYVIYDVATTAPLLTGWVADP